MISANGGLPAHRYTPQVTPRWPRGSEPASKGIGLAGLHYGATKDGARAHTAVANRRIEIQKMLEQMLANRRIEKNQCSIKNVKTELKSANRINSGIEIWDWNQMLRSHKNLHMKCHTRSNMSVQRRNGQQTLILDMAMH